jgi:hypothetical protein
MYNMVTSFIGVEHHLLLKVLLNTNKTGHYVIGYNWHIIVSGVKHQ